ncbi:MAG TPA: plastocyanin/azurin family copper-binding protein, partial [Terriglobales bacterium]|nr:plastocyanin/azurin family copper-binding protein [Terriglobales bacterium]
TADGERALALMKRFGSVTVLNGHIHQIMQKVEGNVSFHTAMSTAFPQPVPQTAPSPGPLKVPAESLRRVLGIAEVRYIATPNHLAVVDSTLAGTPPENVSGILREAAAALPTAAEKRDVHPSSMVAATIGNFAFAPKELNVPRGATVQWTNNDDTPHTVTSDHGVFSSPAMDTRQTFKFTFGEPGTYAYYCKFHPMMTGAVVVR